MRTKRARGRRGVALILVLGSLVILTVFATELQERTATTMAASVADRDGLKAEYHARSSINLTRLLISTEPIVRKAMDPLAQAALKKPLSQIPIWEFTPLVLGPFNDAAHGDQFREVTGVTVESGTNLGLTGGYFEKPVVVAEEGLININASVAGDPASVRDASQRLLGLFGQSVYNEYFEEPDADGQNSDQPTICAAIIDWSDFDEVQARCDPLGNTSKGTEGGEDNYYQTLGLPYLRKNAPYDSIEELRLVRGVSDDFWANFVDPDPSDPKKRTLTVWGSGKVNVNSANEQTLLALICAHAPEAAMCNDVEQMSAFLMGMSLAKQISQGLPLFPTAKSFVRAMQGKGKGIGPLFQTLGLEPVEFKNTKLLQRSITTESRVFSIYAEGVVTGRNRNTRTRIHTVVDFRSANELGAEPEEIDGGEEGKEGKEGTESTNSGGSSTGSSITGDLSPDQIANALASDPLGVIIYHRLD
ncbi:MAG: general secretion pathway protein GspK [Polyangiaceae bacterium]|nr:general secretion pathway protein GspK [Polyangiaceae bacterium]